MGIWMEMLERFDFRTQYLAGSYMYIFSPNKYSFRAAYRQADQQVKSGGSFLAKMNLGLYDMKADTNVFNTSELSILNFTTGGLGGLIGYGYTLNFTNNWSVSALGMVGLQGHYGERFIPQKGTVNFIKSALTYDFKSSIGYNTEKYYCALTFSLDHSYGFPIEEFWTLARALFSYGFAFWDANRCTKRLKKGLSMV